MVEDLLPLVMEPNSDLLRPGPQPHQIRKLEDPSSKDLSFALFLSFSEKCQFSVVAMEIADGQFQLRHKNTAFAPAVSSS